MRERPSWYTFLVAAWEIGHNFCRCNRQLLITDFLGVHLTSWTLHVFDHFSFLHNYIEWHVVFYWCIFLTIDHVEVLIEFLWIVCYITCSYEWFTVSGVLLNCLMFKSIAGACNRMNNQRWWHYCGTTIVVSLFYHRGITVEGMY